MRPAPFALLCLLAPLGALPTPLSAQAPSAEHWFGPRTFMLTAEVGGAAFSDFQRDQAHLVSPVPGSPTEFRRRISASTSATVGAWLAVWPRAGWGVRIGGSFSPSSFDVWNEDVMVRWLERQHIEPDVLTYAGLHVWTLDGTAVFRFPRSFGRVTPYGIAGGGLVWYAPRDDAELPAEARRAFAAGEWRTATAVFGIGAAIPLQRRDLLLTFELTNRVGRTPLDDRGHGESFQMGGIPLQIAAEHDAGSDGVGLTSQVRLVAGITLPVRW